MFCLRLVALIVFFLGFVACSEDMDSLHEQYIKEQMRMRMEICVLKPEYGKCGGHRNLWFYNHAASKCQTFTYSNCGGNRNLFFSLESCQEFCGKYNLQYPKVETRNVAIPEVRMAKPVK